MKNLLSPSQFLTPKVIKKKIVLKQACLGRAWTLAEDVCLSTGAFSEKS